MSATKNAIKNAALETYVRLFSRDAVRIRSADARNEDRCAPRDDRAHIAAALDWLRRAHDVGCDDDGVSAMFSLIEGWTGSYPETTGYIIETLYDAARVIDNDDLVSRAQHMADWLLSCQSADGSFAGSFVGQLTGPRVFNTGQIVFGLLRTARETNDERFLEAARRAGDWLVAKQDDDGAWRRSTLGETAHTYNARTAWALAMLFEATGDPRFRRAAMAGAEWSATQQTASGWFDQNTFSVATDVATLHTIAYAMRGLLETGVAVGSDTLVAAARRTATVLADDWLRDGRVAGAFRQNWTDPAPWRCVPGEAQLAIVWLRLDHIDGGGKFAGPADSLLERVKAAQILDETNPDLYGGVSGSVPIQGSYERYCLVNWGPKFLIDGLILKGRRNGEHPSAR